MKTEFEFTYFRDPRNFAFMSDTPVPCHFCGEEKECLDGDNLYGQEDIDAVCFDCMKDGSLEDLDITANDIYSTELTGTEEEKKRISDEITYRTPGIPTWQDSSWPIRNGKAYRFIKIASKLDYITDGNVEGGKERFISSLHDNLNDDYDWLWSMLPDHQIKNMKEGQYDISFYLFESDGDLLTLWDAN